MAAILRFANVEKTYKVNKEIEQKVLKGVSLEFDSGELVALVGESGSGKSTLINILGGLDMDYTGSVVFKGNFLRDYSESQMDDYRKKVVGLIFQNYYLIGHMTIMENVELAMSMSDMKPEVRRERAIDLLKMVGLEDYKDKLPSQLSGGQKQRVAIARSLANNPSIILADEPTGALDKESADIVMNILKKIAQSGKLVIVVTHSMLVANFCSRVVKLEDGVIASDETNYKIKIEDKRLKIAKPRSIQKKELIKLSYKNLIQRKSRNILAAIGMAIGILAFVLILCLSDGITGYIDSVYGNSMTSTELIAVKNSGYYSSTDISNIESISGIKTVTKSVLYKSASYTYNEQTTDINALSGFYDEFDVDIIYGVLPVDDGYCVVNSSFATGFDANNIKTCIGEEISIKTGNATKTFVISGIYQDYTSDSSKVNVLVNKSDLSVLVPSTNSTICYITVKKASQVKDVVEELEALDITVTQADSTVSTVLSYVELGTKVLTAISMVSLIVAAIMIFIVLYISTVERTREIGLIRAIGGRRSDIRFLFISEATMLGILAGLIGVAGTVLITGITNIVCLITLKSTLISFNGWYYLLGFALSAIIALLAGIAPAYQAANKDPVEALRYE